MKLKDFLEQMKDVDPETEIVFCLPDGCCGDEIYLENPLIDTSLSSPRVIFDTLPFLSTCRKSAAAWKIK